MVLEPPGLLILDCDGVVVDSEPITTRVLAEMLADLRVATDADAVARGSVGLSFDGLLAFARGLLGAPLPRGFEDDYARRTFAALERELRPVAGIEHALDRLRLPVCIASNGPHAKLRKTLGITGLWPRFKGRVFSAQDVARGKPAPDLLLWAAAQMGAAPACCVFVDDSPTGIQAARSAGMRACGYAERTPEGALWEAGAHAVLRDMATLPALLEGSDASARR